MKKTLIETILFCVALTGIAVLLGFTGSSNIQKPARSLHIRVESPGKHLFIMPEMVRGIIVAEMDSLEGQVPDQEKLLQIHKLVHNIPWVDQAAVYRTLDAYVHVDIKLLEPMMRVINNKNQSFYVGFNGEIFPLSDEYTARVMLVSGHIGFSPDEADNLHTVIEQEEDTGEGLKALFELAQYISGDKFWNAFIDQIYVRRDGQFELTPKNGAHIIEFGCASNMEKKFDKLMHFYNGGITQVGWHYYNRINVAYANQVICSK